MYLYLDLISISPKLVSYQDISRSEVQQILTTLDYTSITDYRGAKRYVLVVDEALALYYQMTGISVLYPVYQKW